MVAAMKVIASIFESGGSTKCGPTFGRQGGREKYAGRMYEKLDVKPSIKMEKKMKMKRNKERPYR